MRRQPVDSSSIASVGYDPARSILELEYRNGLVYRYFAVPMSVHQALLEADSIGRYVNANVRMRYRFERIE